MHCVPVVAKVEHLEQSLSKSLKLRVHDTHRLDSEDLRTRLALELLMNQWHAYHSRLHRSDGAVLSVVWHVRRTVEEVVDAVAGVLPDHSTPCRTGNGLASVGRQKFRCVSVEHSCNSHRLAEVAEEGTRLAELDGLV